jgi:branched-chain amino acid transport system substrate-binding protein
MSGLRRKTLAAAVLAGVLLVGTLTTVSAGATVTAQSGNKVLGTKNPAKGTPVKIGFITDDRTASTDNSIETPVANAAVQWINEYTNGIGGHPVELDRCVSSGDPAKSTDCANQMIQDKVAAVLIGSNQFTQNIWTPLNAAGIPVFIFASGNPAILADAKSSFIFGPGSAALMNLNVGAAKSAKPKAKKVTVVSIDVPAATQFYKDQAPALFQAEGLQMELVPIAGGTADMTPQMQRVTSGNPKGVVFVIGNDSFCISAFNGLRTAGFEGTVTAVPQCLSDATRTAVPADFLEGIQIAATAPIDDPKDPSMKQYYAVLDKYGASSVDKSRITGVSMFQAVGGLDVATEKLKGEATPQSLIAAARSMPWSVVPGTGGLHARCNGKANPAQPAVCMTASLAATLDSTGKAKRYTTVNDTEIPA